MPATDKIGGKKSSAIADQLQRNFVDRDDPVYDSEDEETEEYVLRETEVKDTIEPTPPLTRAPASYAGETTDKPGISVEKFEEKVKGFLAEYFASGNSNECFAILKEMQCPSYHDVFVVATVRSALDRGEHEQRLASSLLTLLYDAKILQRAHLLRGFEKLVQRCDDLKLDVPEAAERLMTFLECAIADGPLPASFKVKVPEQFLKRVLQDASLPAAKEKALKDQLEGLQRYKNSLDSVVADFLNGLSIEEFRVALKEAEAAQDGGPMRHELVRKLVIGSFEKTNRQRECVSTLLSTIHGEISSEDMELGFSRLLGTVQDLLLDCPTANRLLMNYMLRAVVDEILPPIFLQDQIRLHIGAEAGHAVLRRTQDMLRNRTKAASRYRKIWNGTDPTSEEGMRFKEEIRSTLLEYFDSEDADEAVRCVKEIEMSPAQASELVRKLLVFAMERSGRECKWALRLLEDLMEANELGSDDVELGFRESFDSIAEIQLDIPDAKDMLHTFLTRCVERGLVGADCPLLDM